MSAPIERAVVQSAATESVADQNVQQGSISPVAAPTPLAAEVSYRPVAPTLKAPPVASAAHATFATEAGTALPLGVTAPTSEPADAANSAPAAALATNGVVPVAPEVAAPGAPAGKDAIRTRAALAPDLHAASADRPGITARVRVDGAPASTTAVEQTPHTADPDNSQLIAKAFAAFANTDTAPVPAQQMPPDLEALPPADASAPTQTTSVLTETLERATDPVHDETKTKHQSQLEIVDSPRTDVYPKLKKPSYPYSQGHEITDAAIEGGGFMDILGEPFGSGLYVNTVGGIHQLANVLSLCEHPEVASILDQGGPEMIQRLRDAQVLSGMKILDLGSYSFPYFALVAKALGAEVHTVDSKELDDNLPFKPDSHTVVNLKSPTAVDLIRKNTGGNFTIVTESTCDPIPSEPLELWFGHDELRSVGEQLVMEEGYYYGYPYDLYQKKVPAHAAEKSVNKEPVPTYHAVERIYEGWTSTVYRVEMDGQPFAVKASPSSLDEEIAIHSGLQHPHILPLLQAGQAKLDTSAIPEDQDGGAEITTLRFTYIPDTLESRLSQLTNAELISILQQQLEVIHYLHSVGVTHGDIKPDNILLEGTHSYLTDFGRGAQLDKEEKSDALELKKQDFMYFMQMLKDIGLAKGIRIFSNINRNDIRSASSASLNRLLTQFESQKPTMPIEGRFYDEQEHFSDKLGQAVARGNVFDRQTFSTKKDMVAVFNPHLLTQFGQELSTILSGKTIIDLGCGESPTEFPVVPAIAQALGAREYIGVNKKLYPDRSPASDFPTSYTEDDMLHFLTQLSSQENVVFHLSGIEPRESSDDATKRYIAACLAEMQRIAKPGDAIIIGTGTYGFNPEQYGFKLKYTATDTKRGGDEDITQRVYVKTDTLPEDVVTTGRKSESYPNHNKPSPHQIAEVLYQMIPQEARTVWEPDGIFTNPDAPIQHFEAVDPNAPVKRDRFGNRVIPSPTKAYKDREDKDTKAAMLISTEGEKFIAAHPGILPAIEQGIQQITETDEVTIGNNIKLSALPNNGRQSLTYLLEIGTEKYIIQRHAPQKHYYSDFTQPYFNEMLQTQEVAAKFKDMLDEAGIELPTFLFTSGHMSCTKYEEGSHPTMDEKKKSKYIKLFIEAYIDQQRTHNTLWNNIRLDPILDNFIKRADGILVWIDPFEYDTMFDLETFMTAD